MAKRAFKEAAATAQDPVRMKIRTSPTEDGSTSRVVAFFHANEFAAAHLVNLLRTHELGVLSATTRCLRYNSAIGNTFYATCTLCVPKGSLAETTFVDGMHPSAVSLVTRVRVPDVHYVKHATRFATPFRQYMCYLF